MEAVSVSQRLPWRALAAVAALAGLVAAARLLPLAPWLEALTGWVDRHGALGLFVFALVYALATVLMVPGSLLTLAAGATFGLLRGFVAVLAGATLGACLAFLVARHLARRHVEGWLEKNPRFAAIDRAVARQGGRIVLLTRLSPVFPFNLQNYAYGLTRVGLGRYALASLFGMMPGTFLYVYLGTVGREGLEVAAGAEPVVAARLALQIVGLLATVAVTVVITRLARRALAEAGVAEAASD